MERKNPIWLWALVVSSLAAALFVLLHLIDDLSQPGVGTLNQVVIGVTSGLLAIVWLFTIGLSLRREPAGYTLVIVLSVLGAFVAFEHLAGAGSSVSAIAQTSGVLFAVIVVGAGIASLLAIVLASYGLLRGRLHVG